MGKVKIGEPNFIFSTKILKSDPYTNNTSWAKYNRKRERRTCNYFILFFHNLTQSLLFKSQPSSNSQVQFMLVNLSSNKRGIPIPISPRCTKKQTIYNICCYNNMDKDILITLFMTFLRVAPNINILDPMTYKSKNVSADSRVQLNIFIGYIKKYLKNLCFKI